MPLTDPAMCGVSFGGMMTNDNPMLPIEPEAYSRLLRALNLPDPKCPVCGRDVWRLQSSEQNPSVLLNLLTEKGQQSQEKFYPVIPCTCDTCGYMYLIDRNVMHKTLLTLTAPRPIHVGSGD